MEWYEMPFDEDSLSDMPENKRIKLCILFVKNGKKAERCLNEVFYNLQIKLWQKFDEERLCISMIYGDERVCVREFEVRFIIWMKRPKKFLKYLFMSLRTPI